MEIEPDPLARGNPYDLVVVVPLGLDPSIFPWGPRLVMDAALKATPTRRCEIWDLRIEPVFAQLAEEAKSLLEVVFLALPSCQRPLFIGHTQGKFLLYELVASLGNQLVETLGLGQDFGVRLDDVRNAHQAALMSVAQARRGRHTVYGFSIYDYTALGALSSAALLKACDPSCLIIIGGDFLDDESAQKLVDRLDFVDAAIVGYGEAPIVDALDWIDTGAKLADFLGAGVHVARRRGGAATPQKHEDSWRPEFGRGDTNVAFSGGKLRLLTQRGCSWSECTFCSQLDRHTYIPIEIESVLHRVADAARIVSQEGAALQVSLDSDENDVAAVSQISRKIAESLPIGRTAHLEFWLMVRSFKVELCKLALETQGRIRHHVRLNIESLSLGRLRLMKKGFSPLQAIEALKALVDCNLTVSTNYFSFYPGEDSDDEAQDEAQLLATTAHLLLAPSVSVSAFPYAMNGRDAIAANAGAFHLVQSRLPESWLDLAFGVDLPYSIWAHSLSPDSDCPPLMAAEMEWTVARKEYLSACLGLGVVRGVEISPAELARTFALEANALKAAADRLQLAAEEDARGSGRTRRISVLNALQSAKRGSLGSRHTGFLRHTELRIHSGSLVSRSAAGELTRTDLSREDLDALRFLYWIRRRSEFEARFPDHSERLSWLVSSGCVIEQRGHLLSVVNDPGYWQSVPMASDIPTRLLEPEARSVKGSSITSVRMPERSVRTRT